MVRHEGDRPEGNTRAAYHDKLTPKMQMHRKYANIYMFCRVADSVGIVRKWECLVEDNRKRTLVCCRRMQQRPVTAIWDHCPMSTRRRSTDPGTPRAVDDDER